MASNQGSKLTLQHKVSLFIGTMSYLLCAMLGVLLVRDALSVTSTLGVFTTWSLIIVSGIYSVLLLGRFYNYSRYFMVTIHVAAFMYFVVSIISIFAIMLLTHSDLAAKLGLEVDDTLAGNKVHLWVSFMFYFIQPLGILTIGDLHLYQKYRKFFLKRDDDRLYRLSSWVYRLKLVEAKSIRRINLRLITVSSAILLFSALIGIFLNVDKFADYFIRIAVGVLVANIFWFLISYGDHKLRNIRVQKGWYGSNATETYELIQFIKKMAEDDSDGGSPPRRFFDDDELTAGAKKSDKVLIPDGLKVR